MSQKCKFCDKFGKLLDNLDLIAKQKLDQDRLSRYSKALFAISDCFVVLHFLFLFVFPRIFSAPHFFGRTWGFHFITYYSLPAQTDYYLLAIFVCMPLSAGLTAYIFSRFFSDNSIKRLALQKQPLFILLAITAALFFFLFNVSYVLLGDNFGIITRVVNNTFMPDEFGSILVLRSF